MMTKLKTMDRAISSFSFFWISLVVTLLHFSTEAFAGRLEEIAKEISSIGSCQKTMKRLNFGNTTVDFSRLYQELEGGFSLRPLDASSLESIVNSFNGEQNLNISMELLAKAARNGDRITPGTVVAFGWYKGNDPLGIGFLVASEGRISRSVPGSDSDKRVLELRIQVKSQYQSQGLGKQFLSSMERAAFHRLRVTDLYAIIPVNDKTAYNWLLKEDGWNDVYGFEAKDPTHETMNRYLQKRKPDPITAKDLSKNNLDNLDIFPVLCWNVIRQSKTTKT